MASRVVHLVGILAAIAVALSALSAFPVLAAESQSATVRGDGLPCAICVILLGIAAQIPREDGGDMCATSFGGAGTRMAETCREMLPRLAGSDGKPRTAATPEEECFALGYCLTQTCNLWGAAGADAKLKTEHAEWARAMAARRTRRATDPEASAWLREAVATAAAWRAGDRRALQTPAAQPATVEAELAECGAERKWQNLGQHLPVCDDDDDWFSPAYPLRGAAWRGRDCNDVNGDIYPGRRVSAYGPEVDHDCNGVVGIDSASGRTYEDLYCSNSSQKGVVILGDSISAHFHVPIYNLTAGSLLKAGLNELDFPQCSWGTGFAQSQQDVCMFVSPLPTDSIYLRMRERNLCNHRDYQDISRNGARSSSMQREIVQTTARRNSTDRPSLVWYGMIANDVCNGHPGTGSMTTPDEYRANTLVTLGVLNERLAPGSTVVLMGHIHGELMWNSVAHKQHLIGTTYGALWSFLGCLEENPCWAWLNADPAWRQTGTEWAQSLTAVSRELAATVEYSNFDLVFVDSQDEAYVADWIAAGGDPADLYEIVDGGHPSLIGESLMARYLWEELLATAPEAVGPVNPNNERIRALFGDQGGH